MNPFKTIRPMCALLTILCSMVCFGQSAPDATPPPFYGPWNAVILTGGEGLHAKLEANDSILQAESPWTLLGWVNADEAATGPELIAGVGTPNAEYPRYLAVTPGKVQLYLGKDNFLEGAAAIGSGKWHLLAATFDGAHFRLYVDEAQVAEGTLRQPGAPAAATTQLLAGTAEPAFEIAPAQVDGWKHFGGKVAGLELRREALSPGDLRQMAGHPIDFGSPVYEEGSKPWPVQTRGQAGYRAPQDPATLPHSKAPFSAPKAKPSPSGPAIESTGDNQWTLHGWRLREAPKVDADGAALSQPAFHVQDWYEATVPGTVLTTLVDRGVYPDPYYGLNNLVIPESLNKQDYWYRTEFRAPASTRGKRLTLTFEGINYKSTVWLNGQSLGTITGAFIRGVFDVTAALKPGETNVLAVRVSPPPHPGIPQEQSIKGGPGENGGLMCLDGPTFVATEGWDWIPAIRDRGHRYLAAGDTASYRRSQDRRSAGGDQPSLAGHIQRQGRNHCTPHECGGRGGTWNAFGEV